MKPFEVIRNHIALFAAIMMLLLALNIAAEKPSLVVAQWERTGIPHEYQAGLLIAGALIVAMRNGPETFILGTLPFAVYCCTTIYVTLDHRGGYPTAIVYSFAYLELLALYGIGKARRGDG